MGWVTPSTAATSRGGKEVDFAPLVVPAVQSCIAAMKAEYANKIDIIIGLSHAGLCESHVFLRNGASVMYERMKALRKQAVVPSIPLSNCYRLCGR